LNNPSLLKSGELYYSIGNWREVVMGAKAAGIFIRAPHWWGCCVLALIAMTPFAWAGETPDASAKIRQLSHQVSKAVVSWRRHIHQHPELSNREAKTAAFVVKQLRKMGIKTIRTGVAHHGVVALIKGDQPGGTVALRADMDALPVQEKSGVAFSSKNKGVMHACGHDAHTAVLLGAAHVLMKLKRSLPGTVKLIFQPAEEGAPAGEEGGARLMVKQGVLKKPRVEAIFALHAFPNLPVGHVGYSVGGAFASVDRFRVVISGKQVHAAYPWKGIDPIVTAAHVITALQTIPSRIIDTRDPVVVSVGIVKGGTRWNIIPGNVVLEGTVRTHSVKVRKRVESVFSRLVQDTAKAHGGTATITYQGMAPVTWNTPSLAHKMVPTLVRSVGAKRVNILKPTMGGEDFAFYAQKVPGFYIRLGVRNAKIGAIESLHTPGFKIDERALEVGVRTMASLAYDYLRQPRK